MRNLLPNRDFTATLKQRQWIETRYSHRYYCKNQMKNIETDGSVEKCPQCDSSDLELIEKKEGMSKFNRWKLKLGNRVVKSYVKNRWPAKKTMDKMLGLKRRIFG